MLCPATGNTTETVLAALGVSGASTFSHFLDSGCTSTIVCNCKFMQNLQAIEPRRVHGLVGYKYYDTDGDLFLPLRRAISRPDVISRLAHVGNLSVEERFHLRIAHTPIEKLAALNGKVTGLPCNLNFVKLTNVPCACCREAKAKRNNYPDASTTVDKDLLTWDLKDMGEEWTTIGGHRYISISSFPVPDMVRPRLVCRTCQPGWPRRVEIIMMIPGSNRDVGRRVSHVGRRVSHVGLCVFLAC
eukprot:1021759-Rhodomonas_salina.1